MNSTPTSMPSLLEGILVGGKRELGIQPQSLSDSSSSKERSSPAILSPFAWLMVTQCDCSTDQALFFTIDTCLKNIIDEILEILIIGNLFTTFLV